MNGIIIYIRKLLTVFVCIFVNPVSALECVQCSSSMQRNVSNLKPEISLILPSMYNGQCRVGSTSTGHTTPRSSFRQDYVFPSMCPINVVPELNSEFRCGYYSGYLTAKTQDDTGQFTVSTFSMRCFQVSTVLPYGCKNLEFLEQSDLNHFQNLLFSKFSSLVKFDQFVGIRCYCRTPTCNDISGASSISSYSMIISVLLCLSFLFL